jgi:PAS domain-containing protein
MVRNANKVCAGVTEIELLVATDVAYIAEVMLNSTGECAVIGSDPDPDDWIAGQIEKRMVIFLSGLNDLQNSLSGAAGTGLDSWRQFYTDPVEITTPETLVTYNVSLGAALEYVMAQLVEFSHEISAQRIAYCNDTWLEGFERNAWSLVPALLDYAMGLYDDQTRSGEETAATLVLLIIITAAVNAFFAFFYIILLRSMWLKWVCIGKGLAQLPKAQIHACINRLSSRRERALVGDERLYYNDCVKLVSAAGGFSELPIPQFVCLILIAIAASILAISSVDWVVGQQLIEVDNVFIRDVLLANMTSSFMHSAAQIVLYLCLKSEKNTAFIPRFEEMSDADLPVLLLANSMDLTDIVDRATIGVVEGESYGMMGSWDRKVAEILLTGPELKFSTTSTGHNFFSTVPVFFYIGLIHTSLVNQVLSIVMGAGVVPNRSNFELVMSMHMLVHHWFDQIQTVFAAQYQAFMDDIAGSIEGQMIILPIVMILIALVVLSLFLWFLNRVERAIHFCLSSLCMIHVDVIMENPVLSNFLSGLFPSNPRQVQSESPLMKALATFAREIVLQLRPDGVVTAANPAIEDRWGIRVADCIEVDLSLIFTFNTAVHDRLATNLDTEITLTTDRTVIPVNSLAYEVKREGEITGYVLFLEDLRDHRRDTAALDTEIALAKDLMWSVVPVSLRPKLTSVNHSLTYVAPWAAVMCVQLFEFDDFVQRPKSVEVLKQFRALTAERLGSVVGVALLKPVGVSEYLLFNSAGELGDAAGSIPLIWWVCQVFMHTAVELDVRLQFGVSGEAQVVMGLMSADDLSFDVFGKVLKSARSLAVKAPFDTLNVDKVAFPTFPSVVGSSSKPFSFKIGANSFVGFEIPLVRPIVATPVVLVTPAEDP